MGSGRRTSYHYRHYLDSTVLEGNLTYHIDEVEYKAWQNLYDRWPNYFVGYEQKRLEHFLTTKLIRHPRGGVLVDVAAQSSPYWVLCREQFGMETYRQDLAYAESGTHTFAGPASSIPLPDDSVDTITLHCSYEHFEGNGDTEAIVEFERILKPGGQACIIPLYMKTPHQEEPVRFYTMETLEKRVLCHTSMEWEIIDTPRKPALIFSNS